MSIETPKKLHTLAHRLHCTGKGLDEMTLCCEEGYDILINATSASLPIAPDHIPPHTLVMDITTQPRETAFLKHSQGEGLPSDLRLRNVHRTGPRPI